MNERLQTLSAEDFKNYFSVLCEVQNWDFGLLWDTVQWYGDQRVKEAAEQTEMNKETIAAEAVHEYKAYLEYCENCVHRCMDEVYNSSYSPMAERIIGVLKDQNLLDIWFDLPINVFADQYKVRSDMVEVFRNIQKAAKKNDYGPDNFKWICFKANKQDGFHTKVEYKEKAVQEINSRPWYSRHYIISEIISKTAEKHDVAKSVARRCINGLVRRVSDHWPSATAEELLDIQYFGKSCLELAQFAQQAFKNGEFDYLNE